MTDEVLINVTPHETRVAIVENGILQEIVIERTNHHSLVGNIYKGKVCRVLPGMQSAFVEIGLERTAFLHVSDLANTHSLHLGGDKGDDKPANQSQLIQERLREGQILLVQVTKEPLGAKGARLTTDITIPSRYLVFLPHSSNMIGISSRIESAQQRQRLKDIALQHTGITEKSRIETGNETQATQPVSSPTQCNNYGLIIRTAAEDAKEQILCADMDFLCRLWKYILEKQAYAQTGTLIYKDLPLVLRTIRDLTGDSIDNIKIDSQTTYQQVSKFANQFIPELVPKIEHHTGERPLFDVYAIDDEINQALERRVPLKSGGYLVIDQTEAMTTIDVNTGTYVGSHNLEETLYKTNLEAAQTIARQLRLRNLGGMIIIDFIDMVETGHQRQVLRTLEKSLERDHTKTHIGEVSSLGLVQMTRQRTRDSLKQVLSETCPTCQGRGSIKTAETRCYDIFRQIVRDAKKFETQRCLVLASQKIVDMMQDEQANSVLELEKYIGGSIQFKVETTYSQEQYDIIPTE